MSLPTITVPPPKDDDHEDVAWALRAASAQWRREEHSDAVAWVRRAAETAEEVGRYERAAELNRLANRLGGGGSPLPSFAPEEEPAPPARVPPPPAGALFGGIAPPAIAPPAIAPPAMAAIAPPVPAAARYVSNEPPPQLEVGEAEDLDLADDEILIIDEDEEIVVDDEVEDLGPSPSLPPARLSSPLPPRPISSAPPARPVSSPPPPHSSSLPVRPASQLPSFPAPIDDEPPPRRARPSAFPSSLPASRPSSSRPAPSPLGSLGRPAAHAPIEDFGEIDFEDEAATSQRLPPSSGVPAIHAAPAASYMELEKSVPAEFAQETKTARGKLETHEEIEQELGVDLSMPPAGPALSVAPVTHPPGASRGAHQGAAQRAAAGREDASPVPGRASVRPSAPPGVIERTSSGRQPYPLAPSADAPRVAPVEPPSRPSQAPPATTMVEPEPEGSLRAPRAAPVGTTAPVVAPAPVIEESEDDDILAAAFSHITSPSKLPPPASVAPPAPRMPSEAPLPPNVGAGPTTIVDGIDVAGLPGFQDLPEDAQERLALSAVVRSLEPGQEISSFAVALVTNGGAALMPKIADATCATATKGQVLFTRGTMASAPPLRIVASMPGTRVAVFSDADVEAATSEAPWVLDELCEVGDRYNAFGGAVLGPLGTSLDEMFRTMVFDKCTVRNRAPGSVIAQAGKPMDGMYIVGVGSVELVDEGGTVTNRLGAGQFIFPETVLSASPARQHVRAGSDGVLLLYADRMGAHELLATCPPFIEILAG